MKCFSKINAKDFFRFSHKVIFCNSNTGAQLVIDRIYNSFVLNLFKSPKSNQEKRLY